MREEKERKEEKKRKEEKEGGGCKKFLGMNCKKRQ